MTILVRGRTSRFSNVSNALKRLPIGAAATLLFFASGCSRGGPGAAITSTGNNAGATLGQQTDTWERLRQRPLRIESIAPGGACPVSPGQEVSPDFAFALGPGPVYPVGLGSDAVLGYTFGDDRGGFPGDWGGQKVLWIARPGFQGIALIRGRQLDGPNELRFGEGISPSADMRLDASSGGSAPAGWHNWPSYTRLKVGGCYAYQVDGLDFSYTIVFQAKPAPP